MSLRSATLDAVLIFPAILGSIFGVNALFRDGFYGYTSLFPLPFKTHALSLLNMCVFYVITFILIQPRKPFKNLSVSLSLLFLFNAVYECMFAIFYDSKGVTVALPLVVGGIIFVFLLNREFHFLTVDRRKIFLAVVCFFCVIAIMLTLNGQGFFLKMRSYLGGETASNPHNPLWVLSKVLCLWMFFPLLKVSRTQVQPCQTRLRHTL